jgi:hypothetical protein
MTPEMKEAVRALGLNNRSFAALLGTGEDTVSGWGKRYRAHRGLQEAPLYAWHLIDAWTKYPDLLRDAVSRTMEVLYDDPGNHIFR